MGIADALTEAMGSHAGGLEEKRAPWGPWTAERVRDYLLTMKKGQTVEMGKPVFKVTRVGDSAGAPMVAWEGGGKKGKGIAIDLVDAMEAAGALKESAEGLEEAGFQRGQRVQTPLGPGQVAYQRMGPPNYSKPVAVSVVLDAKQNKPGYTGTIFDAEKVKPLKEGLDALFTEAADGLNEGNGVEDGGSVIDQMRQIVKEKQARKIQGKMVDLFTANHVVQVYDALNDANKKKLESLPLLKMVDLVWKLVKKV